MEVKPEQRLELRKNHKEMQAKFVYFLLAINAAAIGYTVTIPKTDANWTYFILTTAIILWGLSFLFGGLFLMYMIAHEGANQGLLVDNITEAKKKKLLSQLEDYKESGPKNIKRMLYTLLGGFAAFIIWHIATIPYSEIF